MKPRTEAEVFAGRGEAGAVGLPTSRAAFVTGFVTNALNPKATLFFVSLFVMVVSPQTPKLVQLGYGVWMALGTMAWFSLVAVFFTREDVRRGFCGWGTGLIACWVWCFSPWPGVWRSLPCSEQ